MGGAKPAKHLVHDRIREETAADGFVWDDGLPLCRA